IDGGGAACGYPAPFDQLFDRGGRVKPRSPLDVVVLCSTFIKQVQPISGFEVEPVFSAGPQGLRKGHRGIRRYRLLAADDFVNGLNRSPNDVGEVSLAPSSSISSSWRISPGLIGLKGRSVVFILVSIVIADLVDQHALPLFLLRHRENQAPFTIQPH